MPNNASKRGRARTGPAPFRPGLRERAAYAWKRAQGIEILCGAGEYLELARESRAIDYSRSGDLAAEAARLRPLASEDAAIPRILALVAEASRRELGLDPFETQLVGGAAMCRGKLAQMPTGEGKTLAAVFPAVRAALRGEGGHVLTANDYLAERDCRWMGPIYRSLGLRAAFVAEGMGAEKRKAAYAADLTYLTAREAGFDYLRDGLRRSASEIVQRPFAWAAVDEADFLLIDEARVPLVIAARDEAGGVDPRRAAEAVRALAEGPDFEADRRAGRVSLTQRGMERIEAALGLPGPHEPSALASWSRVHAALRARALLERDVDYVVRGGRAVLVDEFTGRAAPDRAWPYGVQAAIEAAEGLEPRPEGRIFGSIAVRDLLRLYPGLCAMTATAVPSAAELSEAYGLGIVVVPPNRPVARSDEPDLVFRTRRGKLEAVLREVAGARAAGRPALVGTASVRDSEEVAAALRAAGIPCSVLNAKNDGEEAALVAAAGARGAVTVATNMAGRGTDIRLGGPDATPAERGAVAALGGLYVIGTSRHESRRVDDQLRGRSGRQGDPGASRFVVSLEDELFERYGARFLLPPEYRESLPPEEALAADREGPIGDPRVVAEIDRAQRIIEGRRHAMRRALSAFGRPIEIDRRLVRSLRDAALLGGELPPAAEAALGGPPASAPARRAALELWLAAIDRFWAEHLALIDDLREGAPLARYGGRDPDLEFARRMEEAFEEGLSRAEARAAEGAASVAALGPEAALARAEQELPSGTWTYALDEDPLPAFSLAGLAGGSGALASAFAAMSAIAAAPVLALAFLASAARRMLRSSRSSRS